MFPWSKAANLAAFEQEYSMKPVAVSGIYDHDKEIRVEKVRNSEKGFDIITPFYTHLNKNEEPCAILVNRGWVPFDVRDHKRH